MMGANTRAMLGVEVVVEEDGEVVEAAEVDEDEVEEEEEAVGEDEEVEEAGIVHDFVKYRGKKIDYFNTRQGATNVCIKGFIMSSLSSKDWIKTSTYYNSGSNKWTNDPLPQTHRKTY
eukprot:CAMPEP_0203662678 /NCGR_PEP_ID=MMETSP0090-20130426/563_1 /ASSEMBLY_ACC=CAM_ASM_001088 /TAXON_ID=426623 /ORGANISM="Chaetoceros affinis, Strain CCMP159" /LENGTH=117 /DNA_ID=CAMNT_0050525503 /DNA_START=358 /DNA_END=714 /DNA_ORIENTATION=+